MSRMHQGETRIAFASGRTPKRIENNVQHLSLQPFVLEVWTTCSEGDGKILRNGGTYVYIHKQN